MSDELLDVIDKDNNVIDQQMKSYVHERGLPHRVSAVLIKNEEGKYLLPTASEIKVEAGGLFHSAAGHVPSGESYVEAAQRELWEEAGLQADIDAFSVLGFFWLEKDYSTRTEKERFEVFLVDYTDDMGGVKLNDEQINEQWLSEQELHEIYVATPDKLSYPLRLSCEHIFKFDIRNE